ncbi:MAG: hypothetical protein KJ645_00285 [Planctomycetes bacterium]|nr:hypothetical protein [Planctomycetota bacterium]
MNRSPLPIDPPLPEAINLLKSAGQLVLKAPPGTGKTTRLAPALLRAGLLQDRQLLLLEPRRIAARAAARRMAAELGESLGETVGYQVRFDAGKDPILESWS